MKRMRSWSCSVPFDDPHVGDHALVGVVVAVEDQRLQRRASRRRRAAGRAGRWPPGSRRRRCPSLAEARITSSRGMAERRPRARSITVSGSALGRSILLMTGMIVEVAARGPGSTLASVCASIPWLASTTRIAPSQACERAADLVGEVDVAGRVDQVQRVGLAVRRVVLQAHGARLDGDPLLALQVHRVQDLRWSSARWLDRVGRSSSRSARVDLPWSMCATMLKLRMRSWGITGRSLPGYVRRGGRQTLAASLRRGPISVMPLTTE